MDYYSHWKSSASYRCGGCICKKTRYTTNIVDRGFLGRFIYRCNDGLYRKICLESDSPKNYRGERVYLNFLLNRGRPPFLDTGFSRRAPPPIRTAEPGDVAGVFTIKRAVSAPPCGSVAAEPRHAVLSTPKAPRPPTWRFLFPVGWRVEGAAASLGRQAIRMRAGPFCRLSA